MDDISDIPADVSDNVVVENPDTLVNQELVDIAEISSTANDYCDMIDDAQYCASTLEVTSGALNESVQEGGVSVAAAVALAAAVEHMRLKLAAPESMKFPALENFGGKLTRKDGTILAAETIGELAKAAWEKIKAMIAALIAMVKNGFNKIFGSKTQLKQKIELIEGNSKVATESIALEDGSDFPSFKPGPWIKELYNSEKVKGNLITEQDVLRAYESDMNTHGTHAYLKSVKTMEQCLELFKDALNQSDPAAEDQAVEVGHTCFKELMGHQTKKADGKEIGIVSYTLSDTQIEVSCPISSPNAQNPTLLIPHVQIVSKEMRELSRLKIQHPSKGAVGSMVAISSKYIKDESFNKAIEELNAKLTDFVKYADNVANAAKGIDEAKYKRVDRLAKHAYNYTKAALRFYMIVAEKELRMCTAVCDYTLASMKEIKKITPGV